MFRLFGCWLFLLAILTGSISSEANAQIRARSSQDRNEIATLVYTSDQAAASLQRQANAEFFRLRGIIAQRDVQIAGLRARLGDANESASAKQRNIAELEQLLALAAKEKEEFVQLLAQRDQEFERERQILIAAGESLLESPQGAEALRLSNLGGKENWEAAKTILAKVQSVRDAARLQQATAEKRATALLYSQARARGFETTASTIAKWEEVIRLAPDMSDFDELQTLYADAAMTQKIPSLIDKMEAVAQSVQQKLSVALAKGRLAKLRSDGASARANFLSAIQLGEALAASNEAPAAQYLLAVVRYEFAIEASQGPEPETARPQIDRALAVFENAAKSDPDNLLLQQEVIRGKLLALTVELLVKARSIEGARSLSSTSYDDKTVTRILADARSLISAHPENAYLPGFVHGMICGTSALLLDLAPNSAEPLIDECVATSKQLAERDASSAAARLAYVEALDRSIQLSAKRGRWLDADAAASSALRIAREAHAFDPALPTPRMMMAKLLLYRAQIDANLLRRDKVAFALDEGLSLLQQLLLEDPSNGSYLRSMTEMHWAAADFGATISGIASAAPHLRKGLATARQRAAQADALWLDQLWVLQYLVAMVTTGVEGVTATEALAELDKIDRNGLVAPDGRAQFNQFRATLESLRTVRASGAVQ